MNSNLRRVAAVFALLFATQSVALLGPATNGSAGNSLGQTLSAVAGSPQEAEAASYTVRFKNSTTSVSALTICKDWGDTACSSGSPRGYLGAGQWSHLRYSSWTDVDGFYVPGDQKATYTKLTLGRTVSGPAWVKVSDCGGCDVVVSLRWK